MDTRRTDIALFRYSLIRQAADAALSGVERGALVRDLASREHLTPGGERVKVSRQSLDRWVRAYRLGGFVALEPSGVSRSLRTPAAMLELAVALKGEEPTRTAAHIATVIAASHGTAPSPRTLQRHFARLGLNGNSPGEPQVFGRFEAEAPNVRWTGDGMHGPIVANAKAVLIAFLDDHSRLLPGYRWGVAEDTLCAQRAFRRGLESRGVPGSIYLDNGSAFVSRQLLRACASLGVRLVHSRPGRPQGRGKIERFFRTVREQFEVEISHSDISSLDDLNIAFTAWVETVYHRSIHSETKMTPIERFEAVPPPALPSGADLHEAFLWSETRQVTKTATVSLHANTYEVDPALVGRQVDLVFDPFDMTDIDVRFEGRLMGKAKPHVIARHTHPQIKPPELPDVSPVGIDYLGLVRRAREEAVQKPIDYRIVETDDPGQCPGQLRIVGGEAK